MKKLFSICFGLLSVCTPVMASDGGERIIREQHTDEVTHGSNGNSPVCMISIGSLGSGAEAIISGPLCYPSNDINEDGTSEIVIRREADPPIASSTTAPLVQPNNGVNVQPLGPGETLRVTTSTVPNNDTEPTSDILLKLLGIIGIVIGSLVVVDKIKNKNKVEE